jgi:hypothetical protein
MVQYKINETKNIGIRSAGTGGSTHNIASIDLPEQCDEIRFQYYSNTTKNVPFYSFSDRYNVASFTGDTNRQNLDYWIMPADNTLTDGIFTYSQQYIIRNPTSFGKTIYFSHNEIGVNGAPFGVQYQIIGGCNTNGY